MILTATEAGNHYNRGITYGIVVYFQRIYFDTAHASTIDMAAKQYHY